MAVVLLDQFYVAWLTEMGKATLVTKTLSLSKAMPLLKRVELALVNTKRFDLESVTGLKFPPEFEDFLDIGEPHTFIIPIFPDERPKHAQTKQVRFIRVNLNQHPESEKGKRNAPHR